MLCETPGVARKSVRSPADPPTDEGFPHLFLSGVEPRGPTVGPTAR
ncbi:MAG: hypothetical protein JWO69_1989, partial [Thermoleophilia bacterium]|nr:hypothetical protein [Thermoleophilia bacterium]